MCHCLEIVIPSKTMGVYSYFPKEGVSLENHVGKRVIVPFVDKILTGIVIGITELENASFKIKEVIELIDDTPVFDTNLIKLINWVSKYYYSDLGMAFKSALPMGTTPENKIFIRLVKQPNELQISELEARLVGLLKLSGNISDIKTIEKRLKVDEIIEKSKRLLDNGFIDILDKKVNTVSKIKKIFFSLNIDYNEIKLKKFYNDIPLKNTQQRKLLEYLISEIVNHNEFEKSKVKEILNISDSPFKNLEKKNIIKIYLKEIQRNNVEVGIEDTKNELNYHLNDEQNIAYNSILNSINNKEANIHLLFGITGSGKSLVYFKLMEQVVKNGRVVLLMLPEISLTNHFISRVEKAFSDEVLVYHSQLSLGQRYENWEKIKNGRAKVIVGTRSAVFLPIKNLGLIIIDEEHEHSYKQEDPEPRYHARDVAIKRAITEGITIVLGSATPSFESYNNAINGKFILNKIESRADGAKLPSVAIVDSLAAKQQNQLEGSITLHLLKAIEDRIEKNQGIIIYHNRRGYSSFMECQECGDVPLCQNCDIALTYHKSTNRLSCHYCGYYRYVQKNCFECNAVEYEIIGTGTQKVEEEIKEYFDKKNKNIKIERVDLDSVRKKGAFNQIIKNFNSGETDILVGTQMIAKGLDLARVTLVGVVNADLSLYIPDFRSNEKTFQLLTQVSGRAGRSSEYEGEVIVQSHHPENYTLLQSAKHDFAGFYDYEIKMRKGANYPPFTRFIKVEFKSVKEENIFEMANKFYNLIEENKYHYLIYKPVIPVIFKLHKNFRVIMIIKSNKETDKNGQNIRYAIKQTELKFKELKGSSAIRITIDVDTFSSF